MTVHLVISVDSTQAADIRVYCLVSANPSLAEYYSDFTLPQYLDGTTRVYCPAFIVCLVTKLLLQDTSFYLWEGVTGTYWQLLTTCTCRKPPSGEFSRSTGRVYSRYWNPFSRLFSVLSTSVLCSYYSSSTVIPITTNARWACFKDLANLNSTTLSACLTSGL